MNEKGKEEQITLASKSIKAFPLIENNLQFYSPING